MELKNRLKGAVISAEEQNVELENLTENIEKEEITLDKQIVKFKEKTGQDFEKFYEKYLPKLTYYTTKYCRDEDEARDYAEESFISALEKIDTYDSEKAGFSTWLFVIARNHVFQNIKKKKRIPTISMDTTIDEEGTTIKEFLSGDEIETQINNERYSLNVKKAKIMRENIEKLKSPYSTVIKMRELDKMSYKDIASKLGDDISFDINITDENFVKVEDEVTGKIEWKWEFKLPKEISKAYEVVDSNGNIMDFSLREGDTKKTPFFTHIENLQKGNYVVKGRLPKNLSTVKSQIRNGRLKLQDMVKEDFQRLDEMYL